MPTTWIRAFTDMHYIFPKNDFFIFYLSGNLG